MSFFVVDANGHGGDFASNAGLLKLEQLDLPALKGFLETGEATEAERLQIVMETKDLPDVRYIAEMFSRLTGPMRLTNGVS